MSDKVDIKELSIAVWRLEKWLDSIENERKMAAKSALRTIKRFIADNGIEIIDPEGSKFDPGLAVEVVNNESDDVNDDLVIIKTISPYIYQNGNLISYGRVIIGAAKQKPISENDTKEADVDKINDKQNGSGQTDVNAAITDDEIERMMKYAKIL